MKSFGVVLCVLASLQIACSHTSSEEAKDMKQCAEEHHVKSDDMKAFFNGGEASNDLKCFMKCALMRLGTLKEDGTFDAEPMKDHTEHADMIPVVEECIKVPKNDDLCELAYLHSVCIRDKTPKSSEKWKSTLLERMDGH